MLDTLFPDDPEWSRIRLLREELRRHNELYYNQAAPEISDDRYDALMEELRALEAAHPEWDAPDSPGRRIGAAPPGRSKKEAFPPFHHSVPMLSIANAYSAEEIRKFAGRVEGALRDAGDAARPRFVVELKIDGVAFTSFYRDGVFARGATRGDGSAGEDVTASLMAVSALPKKLGRAPAGEIEIRGEIYIPARAFARIVEEQEEAGTRVFANPRNAAAGTLKLLDASAVASRGLECFFYQIVGAPDFGISCQAEALEKLAEWGLPVNPLRGIHSSADEMLAFRDRMDRERHALPYGTDGLVVKLDSFAQQEILGLGSRTPNWAMAYKFAPERTETGVLGIRVQVGKLGRLTPVADLEPVRLAGSTITHASLHNESYVEEKDIRVGDRVLVEKAGEIIPQIESVLKDKRGGGETPFAMPRECPSCGAESAAAESRGQDGRRIVLRFCANPACPAKQFARIVHFASRDAMDIEGMGPSAVQWLLDNRVVKDVSDIYRLTALDLLPMTKEGRNILSEDGERAEPTKMAENLAAAIESSKRRGLGRLLFALSIPDIGETAAQTLARRYKSLDALAHAAEDDVSATGMGESTAYRTLGDKSAAELVSALAKAGKGERGADDAAMPLERYLAGLGIRNFGRKKIEAVARRFGDKSALLAADAGEMAMVEMGASPVKRTLGPIAARSLRAFFDDPGNTLLLERLADSGVLMDEPSGAGNRPVEGRIFVLTGSLPHIGRAEAKRIIEKAGGLVAGTVSRKTDYLVAGADPGGKLARAGELGIEIIDEAGMLGLCEET